MVDLQLLRVVEEVKINGVRLELGSIEEATEDVGGVVDTAVAKVEVGQDGRSVLGVFVKLKEMCREELLGVGEGGVNWTMVEQNSLLTLVRLNRQARGGRDNGGPKPHLKIMVDHGHNGRKSGGETGVLEGPWKAREIMGRTLGEYVEFLSGSGRGEGGRIEGDEAPHGELYGALMKAITAGWTEVALSILIVHHCNLTCSRTMDAWGRKVQD
ncbi:hypothetical protein TrCOL_g2675 [Triparma columacea]|uniref:Uncharacterized protein n=1 Tax=Triparma columacea TaxID=722753 RepID=A0A9W7LAX9_9STRA|nr:hypothetical protein TrCOL_g2675 [Triparma columacea]